MENIGWVRLHRKILDNPLFDLDNDAYVLWTKLLLFATHKEKSVIFESKKITLKPGQILTGRKWLAQNCNITESKTQRILKKLEIEQQIEQQTTSKNRLITIINWKKYQSDEQRFEQQMNNKRTTNEHIQECKNDKNERNNILATSVAVEIPNLLNDNKKHIQIIGLFARAKKLEFSNKEQQSSFLRRNLRAAQNLVGYEFNQIADTMKYLIDNADFKWTLETVGKFIDENLNNLNSKNEDEKIKSFFDRYRNI